MCCEEKGGKIIIIIKKGHTLLIFLKELVKMELMVAIKDYLGMKEAKTGTSSCPHGSAVKFWELSGWVGGGEAI